MSISTADFVTLILATTNDSEATPLKKVLSNAQQQLGRENVPKVEGDGTPLVDKTTGKTIMVKGGYLYTLEYLKTKYSQTMTTLRKGKASLKMGGAKVGPKGQLKLVELIESRIKGGTKGRQGGELDPSLLGGVDLSED